MFPPTSNTVRNKTIRKLYAFIFYILCACGYLMCIVILSVCVLFLCICAVLNVLKFAQLPGGWLAVSTGRSWDRPPRHRFFFLVSLCLKANAEMVPNFPS
jgi:hypothetical protein